MKENALSDLSLMVGSSSEAILEDHALICALSMESQTSFAFFMATLAITRAHSLLIAAVLYVPLSTRDMSRGIAPHATSA